MAVGRKWPMDRGKVQMFSASTEIITAVLFIVKVGNRGAGRSEPEGEIEDVPKTGGAE